MRKLLILPICLLLLACATSEAALEVSYSAALSGALAYVQLPPCPAPDELACSQREIVLRIEASKKLADQALLVARKAETRDTLATAQQAVSAFSAILSSPIVQSAITKSKG